MLQGQQNTNHHPAFQLVRPPLKCRALFFSLLFSLCLSFSILSNNKEIKILIPRTNAFLIGCVRLWDVMRAPAHEEESLILAEADNDIACFSLGDPSKGEKRLVVYVLFQHIYTLSPLRRMR